MGTYTKRLLIKKRFRFHAGEAEKEEDKAQNAKPLEETTKRPNRNIKKHVRTNCIVCDSIIIIELNHPFLGDERGERTKNSRPRERGDDTMR